MTELAELRAEIDELDRQIVPLLARRQAWVVRAGHVKRSEDERAVHAPERVEEVVAHVLRLADEHGLSRDIAERAYRALIQASIELQLEVHRALQRER